MGCIVVRGLISGFIGIWGFSCLGFAQAQILTVGPAADTDCDHHSIQHALDAGADEVRVAQGIFNGFSDTSRDLLIQGGYADCAAAQIDELFAATPLPVIQVGLSISLSNALPSTHTMEIRGLDIQTPVFVTDNSAAGNQFVVRLQSSLVRNIANHSAITIDGPGVDMEIIDSQIQNNIFDVDHPSLSQGGGIHCNAGFIAVSGLSAIRNNRAGLGGGVYMSDGCSLTLRSGDWSDTPLLGIVGNSAHRGSGIYASSYGESPVLINLDGNSSAPASVSDNYTIAFQNNAVNIFNFDTRAAAIFAVGDPLITGINARIDRNRDDDDDTGSIVEVVADIAEQIQFNLGIENGCNRVNGCSSVSDNIESGGFDSAVIVLIQREESARIDATIRQTSFRNNAVTNAILQSNVVEANFDTPFNGHVILEGVVIADNIGGVGYVRVPGIFRMQGGEMTVAYSTIYNNDRTRYLFGNKAGMTLNLYSSVFHLDSDWGDFYYSDKGDTITHDCIAYQFLDAGGFVPNESSSDLSPFSADALYRDVQNGDYRPADDSMFVDYCDDANYTPMYNDIQNYMRGIDIMAVPDNFGAYDLGAWELQDANLDTIFRDGFGV